MEKPQVNLIVIGVVVLLFGGVCFYTGHNIGRKPTEPTVPQELIDLRGTVDGLKTSNDQLIEENSRLKTELDTSAEYAGQLGAIIDESGRLAQSGLALVRSAGQSATGATATVKLIRDNYFNLAAFTVESQRDYRELKEQFDQRNGMGKSNGGAAPGE